MASAEWRTSLEEFELYLDPSDWKRFRHFDRTVRWRSELQSAVTTIGGLYPNEDDPTQWLNAMKQFADGLGIKFKTEF